MKVSDVLFYVFVGITAIGLSIGTINALETEEQSYNERMAKFELQMEVRNAN